MRQKQMIGCICGLIISGMTVVSPTWAQPETCVMKGMVKCMVDEGAIKYECPADNSPDSLAVITVETGEEARKTEEKCLTKTTEYCETQPGKAMVVAVCESTEERKTQQCAMIKKVIGNWFKENECGLADSRKTNSKDK